MKKLSLLSGLLLVAALAAALLPSTVIAANIGTSNTTASTTPAGGLNAGLLGYWTFDGKDTPWTSSSAGTALDRSGKGNTGTLTSMNRSTSPTSGKIGQALRFDGVSYVQTSSFTSSSAQTMAAWICPESVSGNYTIMQNANSVEFRTFGTELQFYYSGDHYNTTSGVGLAVGKCYHVAATYTGTAAGTNLYFYVNGVSVFGTLMGQFAIPPPYSGSTYIGKGSSSNFKGKIDDVRYYNRPLSATEIAQLYKQGSAAMGISNTTASTTPAGGLNAGLVGYWTFDGKDTPWTTSTAGTASDRSGRGNTGTLTNMNRSTAPTSGKIGQALKFNGTNNYVDTSASSFDFERTNSFTLSTWYNYTGATPVTSSKSFFGNIGGPGGNSRGYLFGLRAGGTCTTSGMIGFVLASNFGSNTLGVCTPANTSFLRGWHHAVVTYSGNSNVSGINIYVDGVNQTLSTIYNNLSATTVTGAVMRLGDDRTSDYFPGQMDETRVYNRALSATEVAQLYKQGSAAMGISNTTASTTPAGGLNAGLVGYWTFDGKDTNWNTNTTQDRSGGGNTGTLVSMSTTTSPVAGKIGQGLIFTNSLSSKITTSSFTNSGDFTYSIWVKLKGDSAGSYGNLILFDDGVTYRQLYIANSTHTLAFYGGSTISGPTVPLNTWAHLVFTLSGTTRTFWLNGISTSGGTGAVSSATGAATIGGYSTVGASNAILDDVRIYSRALSATEVAQLYASGK